MQDHGNAYIVVRTEGGLAEKSVFLQPAWLVCLKPRKQDVEQLLGVRTDVILQLTRSPRSYKQFPSPGELYAWSVGEDPVNYDAQALGSITLWVLSLLSH